MEQAGEVKSLSIRKAVIEYGALPIASWLPRTDSLAAIQLLLKQLTDHRMVDEDKRCKYNSPFSITPLVSEVAAPKDRG